MNSQLSFPNCETADAYTSDDSFTCDLILYLVRQGLGTIEWDLASSSLANKRVKAKFYFSRQYSFLANHEKHNWQDRFWCNPPFKNGALRSWAAIIANTPTKTGYFLGPLDTSTEWFQLLSKHCTAAMFSATRDVCKLYQPSKQANVDVARSIVIFAFGLAQVQCWKETGQFSIWYPG